MTIQAHVARPLFAGFIAHGLESVGTEMRHVLVNLISGSVFANQSNVEYAIWPAAQLGSIGAPTYKSSAGSTNAQGELVVATTGTFNPGDEVIVAVRQAAGAAGGADDNWGIGVDTISSA